MCHRNGSACPFLVQILNILAVGKYITRGAGLKETLCVADSFVQHKLAALMLNEPIWDHSA